MKILIVKSSSFGDIVHAFPVLELLKSDHLFANSPSSAVSIDWVVEQRCASLVAAHPKVERALVIDTAAWKRNACSGATFRALVASGRAIRFHHYDVVIDLQGNCKSAIWTAIARAPVKVGFGFKSLPEWPNFLATTLRINPQAGQPIRQHYLEVVIRWLNTLQIYPSEEAVTAALRASCLLTLSPDEELALDALLRDYQLQEQPTVLFCPYSAWPSKQLPTPLLRELLTLLTAAGIQTAVVVGSEKEREAFLQLQQPATLLFDRMSLPLLQRIMQHAALIVATDSLPLHLAATTATPIFSFFGPSSSQVYRPVKESSRAFQGRCPYGISFTKRCSRLRSCSAPCMEMVKADRLFSAIQEVICTSF